MRWPPPDRDPQPPAFWQGALIGAALAAIAWIIMFAAVWPYL